MTASSLKTPQGPKAMDGPKAPDSAPLRAWFASRGWVPSAFQEELWEAWRAGESGLLMAPTGVGKTMAAWGGALVDGLARRRPGGPGPGSDRAMEPLRFLWITPLRALARDTAAQLREPLGPLGLPWTVEVRTGDTASSRKVRQRTDPPTALVTTPESLSILLSWPGAARRLRRLRGVVVDEWHELLGSKRGVQLELGLARLRLWNPGLRCWGLSATLPNEEEAMEALLGCEGPDPYAGPIRHGRIIRGPTRPAPLVTTLLPPPGEAGRFPWAGHLGLRLLPGVVERLALLDAPGTRASALLFTNTRSQAERWHEALARARPDWEEAGRLALHHGSLDRRERERVESGLRDRSLLCVVCTSTLELGVDLPAVELVIQVGSPRGVGRLLQRAGRSEHTPDGRSRLLGVPTHALEIAEFAAARRALEDLRLEPRRPLEQPLDVLAQHLVTVALGGGFRSDALFREVRTARAFRDLSPERWTAVLDLVTRGGAALQAYPRYRRVAEEEGVFRVADADVERRHRWSIGTITDDAQLRVRFRRGTTLGSVEESFLAQLRPGDTFLFGGRHLALLEIRDLTAWVRLAPRARTSPRTPRWMGGRLPLSTELAGALLETLRSWETREDDGADPEFEAVRPLLALQAKWSRVPGPDTLLVERTRSREGHHVFLYPFLGRLVHEGLGALVAHRISRTVPRSIQLSANDYGIEFLSPDPFREDLSWRELLDPGGLDDDILQALNAAELSKRRFRGVARVAGLLVTGPGGRKTARQLQASSGLLFDVLARWDPDNLLLAQARREALESELDFTQLGRGLKQLSQLVEQGLIEMETPGLTPLAFPLWAERLHARVSTERWIDRVTRMAASLERAAGSGRAP